MTDNFTNWTKKLDSVYYGNLVSTDVLENILSQVVPAEIDETFKLLLDLMDWLMVYQLAQVLSELELKEFLHNIEISYNNPDVLNGFFEIYPDLEVTLKQVVQRQLLAVYSGLQKNL